MRCPQCKNEDLDFLEVVYEDSTETKTAWSCAYCNLLMYAVYFKEEEPPNGKQG